MARRYTEGYIPPYIPPQTVTPTKDVPLRPTTPPSALTHTHTPFVARGLESDASSSVIKTRSLTDSTLPPPTSTSPSPSPSGMSTSPSGTRYTRRRSESRNTVRVERPLSADPSKTYDEVDKETNKKQQSSAFELANSLSPSNKGTTTPTEQQGPKAGYHRARTTDPTKEREKVDNQDNRASSSPSPSPSLPSSPSPSPIPSPSLPHQKTAEKVEKAESIDNTDAQRATSTLTPIPTPPHTPTPDEMRLGFMGRSSEFSVSSPNLRNSLLMALSEVRAKTTEDEIVTKKKSLILLKMRKEKVIADNLQMCVYLLFTCRKPLRGWNKD